MNIFIYGSDDFKNDMYVLFQNKDVLSQLSSTDRVEKVGTLIELRGAIQRHPKDIFLIDDAKIVKENSINEKMGFLKPNDAIEESFIKAHGIETLQVNSVEELSVAIIEKLNRVQEEEVNVEESIISMVNDAYGQDEELQSVQEEGNEEIEVELDDKLRGLLVCGTDENRLINNKETIMDEELNSLDENAVLEALEGLEDMEFSLNTTMKPSKNSVSNNASPVTVNTGAVQNENDIDVNTISTLIQQLLNNKTVEITIKLKD